MDSFLYSPVTKGNNMKSAEEWNRTRTGRGVTLETMQGERNREQWIREIQLDAMKEGARRAAEQLWEDGNPMSAKKRILTTAEQWAEKDL